MMKFIVPGAAVLIIAGLLVFNHLHRLRTVDFDTVSAAANLGAPASENSGSAAAQEPAAPLSPDRAEEFTIKPMAFRTADTSGRAMGVGIKLVFEKGPLEKEIRLKEANISRLMKFVFSNKGPAEITADPVRMEIKERINAFLSSGKVSDVVITRSDTLPAAGL